MDYEKKYKEALEKAKRLCALPTDKATMEEIFPELRESEDERIRKILIEVVNITPASIAVRNKRELLDWLKKQKEQKPVDYDHEMWKNCEVNFEGGKKEVIEHPEKYGLQKQAEWSEEDEKFFELLRAALYQIKVRIGKDEYDKAVARLKSLRPSWKPSEEQMKQLKYEIDSYYEDYPELRHQRSVLESLYNDLKKL